jgi:hypothetical protein
MIDFTKLVLASSKTKSYLDSALAAVDADVNAIYTATVGARQSEYALAESEALGFKEAGYPVTPIPLSVSAWSNAKGETARWAADSIITNAGQWRAVQATIRVQRLAKKEAIRLSVSVAEIDLELASWAQQVAAIRTALGQVA